LTELAGAHLLVEGRPGRYAPHDLLRAYARELAGTHDPAAEQRAAAHRLLDYYLHNAHVANHLLYPNRPPIEPLVANATVVSDKLTDRRDALCWFGTEYSSLLAAVEYAAANDFDAHAWQLASTLWAYVRRGGYWRDKVAMHQAALGAAQRLKSPEARAHMHHGLATAYADMGRDEDAYAQLGLALEALPDAERSVLKADTHQGLSWICDRRGCYGEALEHARQALALFHRLGHRSGQASALNNVGWLHARLGDYARALALCGQALDIFREFEDHAYGADAWDSLGYTHHRLGDHEQAIAHYRHALELHREAGSRYCESRTLSRLGELLASGGDHLAAERALRRALDILCELAHPDADAVRATLESLPVAQGGVSSVAAGH
jgi:tetratricopeptide (TPR) repeat protein